MDRARAIEAVRLLNDLWADIVAGDGVFQMVEDHGIRFRSEEHIVWVQRMIFFHLAMVLCKLVEFHKHYYVYLPEEGRLWLTDLKVEVNRRRIRELRNKVIGHILDKKTGAPLTPERLDEYVNRLVDNDSEAFCSWIRNAKSPGDLATVIGRVKWLIDEIMRVHPLTAADVGLKPGPAA